MKKVIVFDMDGVLFDTIEASYHYIRFQFPEMTREHHKELSIGNFHEEFEKYKKIARESDRTPEEIVQHKEDYKNIKILCPMYKGMKELLETLHQQGYILVLNTSAISERTLPLLEVAGIAELFDFVATMDLSKSKVEKFALIDKKYNASKSETLFITDTLGDIREADIAGIPTVAVTWGLHDRSYFEREKHDNLIAIIDSVEELKKVIDGTL
jgi:HAD superfamily hydrolase (TIGR01509 family)